MGADPQLGVVNNSIALLYSICGFIIPYSLFCFIVAFKSVSESVCFCPYVNLGKKKTDKEGRPKGNKEVHKHVKVFLHMKPTTFPQKVGGFCGHVTQTSLKEAVHI